MVAVKELEEEVVLKTPQEELREWLRAERDQRLHETGEAPAPQMADAAASYFLNDPGFLLRRGRVGLRAECYQRALQILAETRRNENLVAFRGQVLTADKFRERMQKKAEKWAGFWRDWCEHAGASHHRLWDMDRRLLLLAANERRARAHVETERAAFLEALAAQLQDEETVGDHFTEEQVGELYVQTMGGSND